MPSLDPDVHEPGHHVLVLLRHGKSDWSGGEADRYRPLAKRGRRQASEAGRWLATAERRPAAIDLAVVSPATRTRRSWELVEGELAASPPTRVDERVYAATATELISVVRELPEEVGCAVLVGHNPGLEDLAARLTGSWTPMPTSALVLLRLDAPWSAVEPGAAAVTAAGRPPD